MQYKKNVKNFDVLFSFISFVKTFSEKRNLKKAYKKPLSAEEVTLCVVVADIAYNAFESFNIVGIFSPLNPTAD